MILMFFFCIIISVSLQTHIIGEAEKVKKEAMSYVDEKCSCEIDHINPFSNVSVHFGVGEIGKD